MSFGSDLASDSWSSIFPPIKSWNFSVAPPTEFAFSTGSREGGCNGQLLHGVGVVVTSVVVTGAAAAASTAATTAAQSSVSHALALMVKTGSE